MSELFKVCLYSHPGAVLQLKSLLPPEGPFTLETIDQDGILSLSRSAQVVLVIEAALLSSLDQGDGLEALAVRLAALPLIILYEVAELNRLAPLLENENLNFDLLPSRGLDPLVFQRTLRQAKRRVENERRLTRHLRHHEALLELGRLVGTDQPIQTALERSEQLILSVLDVEAARIVNLEADAAHTCLRAVARTSGRTLSSLAVLPLLSPAPTSEAETPQLRLSVAIPSPEDKRPFGDLVVYSRSPRPFLEGENDFLASVGNILGTAILKNRLKLQLLDSLEVAQKNSELLEQMMISIHDCAIFMIDPLGFIMNWNSGAEKITGLTKAEVVGRHWSFLHPDEPMASSQQLEAALAVARNTGRYEAESTSVRKDGSSLLISTTIVPVYDGQQQLRGYTEMLRDVTQERQSQERLRLAFDIAQMSSWDWDLRSGQVRWSVGQHASAEQIALSLREFRRLVFAPDLPRLEDAVGESLLRGQDLDLEFRLRDGSGAVHWKVVKGRVLYDEHKQPLQLTGISMDVSEKKRAERELQEAKEAAERANEAKSIFLAHMSHEIRTPLNAILGFAELMQNAQLSAEKQRDFIGTITRNGKLLSQLIDDILDLSKVEASKLEVEHIRCSLPDLMSDVLKLYTKQASDKGIYLRLTSGSGLPETFVSDPNRLKQILLNIVGNAVKFTQEGGIHVNVNIKHIGLGRAPQLVFSVIDTGCGIDARQQQRLFQAFSQADASVSRNFGGTGLGLILSRRLAELLGGNVELIYSKPGAGSTFCIEVEAHDARGSCKLSSDSEKDSPSAVSASAHPLVMGVENERLLEGVSVLIVEDAPDSRALAAQILNQYGAQIEMAENGLVAVDVLQSRAFDVVLMDLQMPELDGFAATAELRARGYSLPILAVSAAAMKDEIDRALEVGCNDHLTKPFSIGILIDKILGYAHRSLEKPCLTLTGSKALTYPPAAGHRLR